MFRHAIRYSIVLAALGAGGSWAGVQAQTGQATLFRGVRVFDGSRVLSATDVLVQGGRIAAIGRGLSAPANATIVAGGGKTLLPGLIDSHTHVYGDALKEAVMFGVTTELDMFTDATGARALRAEQGAGRALDRADIVSAGTLVTAPGGHGIEYGVPIPTITSPDSAQSFVDARIAEGSDYIKLVYDDGALFALKWPSISRATMRAVIEAAYKRNKMAVVHVSTALAARQAIEAGANGLVHLFTDTLPAAGFAQLALQRKAFVIPTLVVLRSIAGTPGAAPLLEDARLQPYIGPTTRMQLSASFPARGNAEQRYGFARTTVRQLKAAGVPILAGTDAPNPGTAHGLAMHRELELLVEAGLSPAEALAAATSVPAAHFKLADRGAIAVGKRADLLLVNGDPTTDITATRAIEGVWKQGNRIDRAAYAAVVAQQIASYGKAPNGLENGLVADFESGTPTAAFGLPLVPSDDSYAGGKSKVEMTVVDGGAKSSRKSLRMTGTVDGGLPYAWAGSMWSPGAQMMQPADLSSKKEVHFWVKGDGGTYRMYMFFASGGSVPQSQAFVAGPEWREVVIPWSAFNTNGKDVMALVFAGGPTAGAFNFQIDDIRIR